MVEEDKLKTLKDFKAIECPEGTEYICSNEVLEEIKQEVVKWIKELRKDFPKSITPMRMGGKNRLQQLKFTEHWIKHFFNITDEDLK